MSVGQRISDARGRRGMTVADVAAATRIRASIITRIEADEFDGIDAEVFVRSYVRTIATTVGLDPQEILELFVEETGSAMPVVRAPIAATASDIFAASKRETLPPKKTVNRTALIVALVIVAVVIVVFKVAAIGH